MDHREGADKTGDVRLDFDRRVRLEFHGSKISVNAGLKLLHSPERKYLSLTGIGLSIDPHSGVPPNSCAVVRGCGQTGGRCLGFRLRLTVGCV